MDVCTEDLDELTRAELGELDELTLAELSISRHRNFEPPNPVNASEVHGGTDDLGGTLAIPGFSPATRDERRPHW
jgi:hypothetical protein